MKKESINIVLQHHNMRRQQSEATRLSGIITLKNIRSTNSTECRRRIITFGDIIFKPTEVLKPKYLSVHGYSRAPW
jgi:hypothetical protein